MRNINKTRPPTPQIPDASNQTPQILENKIQLAYLFHSCLKLPFYFHHYPLVLVMFEIQTKLLLAGDEGLVTDHLFNPAHICQQHPVLVHQPVRNRLYSAGLVFWPPGFSPCLLCLAASLCQDLHKRGT